MNIPLPNDYRLSADKYQWIVQRKKMRKEKDGSYSEDWESKSYHGTINQAINHHANVLIRTSDTETLMEALKVIESVTTELTNALTPVFEVKLHLGEDK